MKNICIICQKQGGKLHRIEFKTAGQNMLQISKMLTDKSFFRRLENITSAENAVGNDVLYHSQCWVIAKRKAKPKSSKSEDHVHTLSGECWQLHLERVHAMIPYFFSFFSFDMFNYARMSTVYLSQVMQMKGHDPTWDYLKVVTFLSTSLPFLLQLLVLTMVLNRRTSHLGSLVVLKD